MSKRHTTSCSVSLASGASASTPDIIVHTRAHYEYSELLALHMQRKLGVDVTAAEMHRYMNEHFDVLSTLAHGAHDPNYGTVTQPTAQSPTRGLVRGETDASQ